jgi:16S rRNA (guanine1207-N2)-methyltransferase
VADLLYGVPAPGLVEVPKGAVQCSPLIPGSADIAEVAAGSADSAVVQAPPGTLERDAVLAQALRALKPGGTLTVLAPKDKGGARLKKALEGFGAKVGEDARRHHRFAFVTKAEGLVGLDAAIAAGAPRIVPSLGLWSQPGVFSWDRADPGSLRLIEAMPAFSGRGADLGCGVGLLAQAVLQSPTVEALACADLDRRAVECARHNLDDPRVTVSWADLRTPLERVADLDFVVMNPPFHDGGAEDRALGQAFIATAAAMLGKGGVCWLVANRHLPYEAPLGAAFKAVTLRAEGGGYKIYEARR